MTDRHTRHSDRHDPIDHEQRLVQDVKDALLRGTESAGLDVRVASANGTIRLYGVVDVFSQKTAAEAIARRIPGVRHVENDITVANEGDFGDKRLLEVVTERLTSVPDLRDVGCRVHRGRVELVGHVATRGDEMRAVQVAGSTPSVAGVTSHLKIGEGQDEDEGMLSRVAERLLDQMGLDSGQFEVYADAGVLFVKGFVKDDFQRKQVIRMMERLDGVQKVEATLITHLETGGEIH